VAKTGAVEESVAALDRDYQGRTAERRGRSESQEQERGRGEESCGPCSGISLGRCPNCGAKAVSGYFHIPTGDASIYYACGASFAYYCGFTE
jgi:hypothetical protein